MSSPQQVELNCPACKHRQEFTIWDSINVTVDPQLKAELVDGDLTLFKCQQCGNEAQVPYPLLYHDMATLTMIWLSYDPKGFEEAAVTAAWWTRVHGDGYLQRFVTSLRDLIEKIRISDRRLDDRLIELFKLSLLEAMPQAEREATYLCFWGMTSPTAEESIGRLVFAAFGPEGPKPLEIPYSRFHAECMLLGKLLVGAPSERGGLLKVDADFARKLMGPRDSD